MTCCDSVFACFCFSFFPIVYLLYPETSRRTLEDMDEIFRGRGSVFVFRDPLLTQRGRPQAFVDAERRKIDSDSEPLENAGANLMSGDRASNE